MRRDDPAARQKRDVLHVSLFEKRKHLSWWKLAKILLVDNDPREDRQGLRSGGARSRPEAGSDAKVTFTGLDMAGHRSKSENEISGAQSRH